MDKSTQSGDSPPPQYSTPDPPPRYSSPNGGNEIYPRPMAFFGPSAPSSSDHQNQEQSTQQQQQQRQQIYVQQMFPEQFPQALYNAQGQQIVFVSQPQPQVRTDWTLPKAKFPAILTIVAAVLNLVAFVGIGLKSVFYAEFCTAFVLYLLSGITGILASKSQRTNGVAIACLVIASASLVMAVAQIVLRALAIDYGTLMVHRGGMEGGQMVIWVNVAILLVSLLSLSLSVVLIIVTGKELGCGNTAAQRNPEPNPNIMIVPQAQINQAFVAAQ